MKKFLYSAMILSLAFAISCDKDPNNTETTTNGESVVINGVSWATRNLKAHGEFVENTQDYGAFFQWGRKGDGHEQRISPIASGPITVFDANGQPTGTNTGRFITNGIPPWDWRTPQQNTLWNSGTESNPIKTVNDPCTQGWRMPTETELTSLGNAPSTWTTNWNGTGVAGRIFGTTPNTLFLPAAGYRSGSDGGLNLVGTNGYYWSSTVYRTSARGLNFFSGNVGVYDYALACGRSVRCVLE